MRCCRKTTVVRHGARCQSALVRTRYRNAEGLSIKRVFMHGKHVQMCHANMPDVLHDQKMPQACPRIRICHRSLGDPSIETQIPRLAEHHCKPHQQGVHQFTCPQQIH